ncbi:MAG: cytochrome c biogenesis protein CcsA [Acidimicrobiales bacterium]
MRNSEQTQSGTSTMGGRYATKVLGWSAAAALALTAWWGLWVSPPDVVQGQLVRILYVHPAVATMCYAGFGLCALGSLAWLWPRTRSPRWDRLAVAGAELGSVFCLATLVTGSIWGRATWGVWWTWDPRLTLTAVLFALSLGYLALRRSIDNARSRSFASSVVALLMALTVVVDHYATSWWASLHQGTTLFKPGPSVHGWQLATMLVSFLAFGLAFCWMAVHRYRLEVLEERYEQEGLQMALAARRSEAGGPGEMSQGVALQLASEAAAVMPPQPGELELADLALGLAGTAGPCSAEPRAGTVA